MVKPAHRSRSLRRVRRTAPGGRVTLQFRQRKPNIAKCVVCGTELKGVIRALPSKMQNTPKTKKRPERPFGGNLCSQCMRRRFIQASRKE